jgi:hypothetical protein
MNEVNRRCWAKAVVATSHKLLVIAFQVLKNNTHMWSWGAITSTGSIPPEQPGSSLRDSKPVATR